MTKRFKLIGDSNLEVLMQHQLELPIYDYNNKKSRLSLNTTLNLLNSLYEENEELNSIKKFADRNGICIFNIDEAFRRCWQDNAKLVKENEELKQEVTHWKKILDNHQQIVAKTLREQYHWLKNEDKILNHDKTVALLELESISERLGIDLN